jgi:hypothetical protein
MNLTEITQSLMKELESQKQTYQELEQKILGLKTQDQLLTSQIQSKENREAELALEVEKLSKNLQEISKKAEQDQAQQSQEHTKRQLKFDLDLKAREKLFEIECSREQEKLDERSQDIERLENTLKVKSQVLTAKEQDLGIRETEITTFETVMKEKNDEFDRVTLAHNAVYDTKMRDLDGRDKEIMRKEQDLAERSKSIVDQEKKITLRENNTLLTSQKTEEQSNRLSTFIETYQNKLEALHEKEKVLEMRSIKLSDREAVAATHKSS